MYLSTCALVGWEPIEAALGPVLSQPLALHAMVVVQRNDDHQPWMVYDFLPERPTELSTAVSLISGGKVQGTLRRKALRQLPGKCKLQGHTEQALVDDAVARLHADWDLQLQLLSNDCWSYANRLIPLLTR